MKQVGRLSVLVALLGSGCAGEIGDPADDGVGDTGDGELHPIDDTPTIIPNDTLYVGELVRVCNADALNQRSGAGMEYGILRAIPEGTTVEILELNGPWARNDWSGRVGWSSRQYLCPVTDGGTEPSGFDASDVSPAGALAIARASVGYTYWWGHGKLDGTAAGACYGGCPDCTHDGDYGADCSGFVSKTWMLGESLPFDEDHHPFSTYNFYNEETHWTTIDRGTALPADAMVHRESGSGHIFLYEKDDPWGSMWSFEARGCAYGIVHNLRTANSTYKAIRRNGF